MSKSNSAPQTSRLRAILIGILFMVVIGIAAWTATSSPALGASGPVVMPTYVRSFAFAEIAKPTYTPLPTTTALPSTEIATVTDIPTNAPESVIQAVIVDSSSSNSNSEPEQAPVSYSGNKYILVDISEQHMYVYEADTLVFSFIASTGMNNGTRVGSFSVLDKIPNAYGATWNIWMPNWLGIYWSGSLENGIHALPILSNGGQLWAGYLGVPISYGCVVLGVSESQILYDWAEIGTPVEIQR
ncbi:MAG: L,D-transpeptidase [Anaerolineales bacterium]|nr:L,D-transpeptidase [Anaerolineales bacterium]